MPTSSVRQPHSKLPACRNPARVGRSPQGRSMLRGYEGARGSQRRRAMRSHARVVVIGGGAVGVATLYQLTRKGWSDVVLVERKELTSGSTWHAAGLLPLFNMSYSVGQIHKALGSALPDARGRDRPERGLQQGLQHPPRAEPRPHGRVPPVCRRRGDDRRRGRVLDAAAGARRSGRSATSRAWSARSATRATATSSRPISPRRWPRGRATAAPRSIVRPR